VARLVFILLLFVAGASFAVPKLYEREVRPGPVDIVVAPRKVHENPPAKAEPPPRPPADEKKEYAAWQAKEPKEKEAAKAVEAVDAEIDVNAEPAIYVPEGDEFVVERGKRTEAAERSQSVPARMSRPSASGSAAIDSGPLRAAFYYPWFPRAWTQDGVYPFSTYKPSLGYYESSDPGVIRSHIEAMQYGYIDAGISSWWGPSDFTDDNFATLLAASAGTGFRWAIHYELEGTGNPAVAQIRADLAYIQARYANDPSYLKIANRFVVFVFVASDDGCELADRWREAAPANAYLVLAAFAGQRKCDSQPDGWYVYDPSASLSNLVPWSYTISPGYSKPGDPSELARDLARWRKDAAAMALSGARLQLIVSFNEWGEGSAVESSDSWATPSGYGAYLDVLHELG
jgi:hypothetical protein